MRHTNTLLLALATGAALSGCLTPPRDGHDDWTPAAEEPVAIEEPAAPVEPAEPSPAVVHPDDPTEPRLRNVTQITFAGENAEAYWSWKGDKLVYQFRGRRGFKADQIHIMNPDGSGETLVSTGNGRTTCAYFLHGDEEVVFASTHHLGAAPPKPPPPTPGKYTWPLFDYDIYRANADGTNLHCISKSPGYDAEPTVGPDGRIVFTSARGGDLDIFTMNADGSDVKQLTDTVGYDGGAFFSHDGKKICYRAYHPTDPKEIEEWKSLLASERVQPGKMDIWVMNADGSDQHKVTDLGGASFSPFFLPDNERVIFATNFENPRGRNFDLYIVNIDGTGLERVTTSPEFDCFPMFSPDGKRIAFASNRHGAKPGDTNIFVAEWVE